MSQGVALGIVIAIIVGLLAIFFVSFVLYRKTPIPEGCEDIKASEEKCSACAESSCPIYIAMQGRDKK